MSSVSKNRKVKVGIFRFALAHFATFLDGMVHRRSLFLSCVIVLLCSTQSFQFGGMRCPRYTSLLARINKTPGVEVPADKLRGTTVPTTSGSLKTKEDAAQPTIRSFDLAAVDPADPFTFGYVNVGKILGAHGVHGEVKVQLSSDFTALKMKAGSEMYIRKPTRRTPRPVRVARSRKQGSSDSEIHLLLFEEVHTRTVANLFSKYEVYIKDHNARANVKKDEYMVRDLVDLDCYHIRDYETVMTQSGEASENAPGLECSTKRILPIARVVGVIPADELCEGPTAASLMHSQLELQVFPTEKPLNRAARRKLQQSGAPNKSTSVVDHPPRVGPKPPMMCCLLPLVPSIVPVVDIARKVIFLDPPEGLLSFTYEVKEKPKPLRGFLPAHIEWLTEEDRRRLEANLCKR